MRLVQLSNRKGAREAPTEGVLILDMDRIESLFVFDQVQSEGIVAHLKMRSGDTWWLDEVELAQLRFLLPTPAGRIKKTT